MKKRVYPVNLTPDQEEKLRTIAYTGSHPVRTVINARALLKAASGSTDREISEALEIAPSTVFNLRRRFHQKGLDACLKRREQKNRFRKITGDVEARIVQIACSQPPGGRSAWTLDLITERIIELKILPSIGRSAVHDVLKKTNSNHGLSNASASHRKRTANS